MKIDLTLNKKNLENAVKRAKEKNVLIPTFEQMKNPEKIPGKIKDRLKNVGLWDLDPANLFRISWKNEAKKQGGLHAGVNYIEIPECISGVKAKIFMISGKWFPTGAHKVGASFACLVPRLVTGQFDPTKQKAVWPSTGNYCRGGAYNSALLGCDSIAILPEEMSKERFEWLKTVAGEVIATPGCESNVKEIYDKCWELRKTRGDDIMIFNQFEEMGNHLWHYEVTGHAMEEVIRKNMKPGMRFAGMVSNTGSAGSIASGDYLKKVFPNSKIVASEALQCPTLLNNGFGGHRIEGIGDKHVPWVHNVRNTDFVVGIDDEDCVRTMRLFNEPDGKKYLEKMGCPKDFIEKLDWFGISGIANMIGAIKTAKYLELDENDMMISLLTDSSELYTSRIDEYRKAYGAYSEAEAKKDLSRHLYGVKTDNLLDCRYEDRKRIHNLKYYTWIEQQGKTVQELNDQWYNHNYWTEVHSQTQEIDNLINQFNEMTGLI